MSVLLFGVSHRSAPVSVLEQLSTDESDQAKIVEQVLQSSLVTEAMVLSTCNRYELYVAAPGLAPEVADALQKAFASFASGSDKTTLARLGENVSPEGFVPIEDASFADIRTALENEIPAFEGGH